MSTKNPRTKFMGLLPSQMLESQQNEFSWFNIQTKLTGVVHRGGISK